MGLSSAIQVGLDGVTGDKLGRYVFQSIKKELDRYWSRTVGMTLPKPRTKKGKRRKGKK